MAVHDRQARLRLQDPPVRATSLSIQFEQSAPLRASHVIRLHQLWSDQYAIVEDSSPDFEMISMENTSEEDFDREGTQPNWPIPAMRFTDADGSHSVHFQDSRFGVEWKHSGLDYPGFEELFTKLTNRFNEFQEVLESTGIRIRVTRNSCRYENEMKKYEGPELAAGILTGWKAGPIAELQQNGYVGLRIHACTVPENQNCNSYVSVDASTGKTPILSIDVRRRVTVVDNSDSNLDGVRAAHDELIDLFLRYTNAEQRDDWGLIS